MKRFSSLAHLVLGISLGLAPIAGVIAVQGAVPLWSVLLAFGVMFWVAGFDVLYSLQDIQIDKKEGLFSIPSRFGVEKALWFSRVFHVLAVVLWCGFLYLAGPRAFFTTNGYLGFVLLVCIVLDSTYSLLVGKAG